MPHADTDDGTLFYETAGNGPTVAFVNPVGYGAWCWAWLADALAGPVETLVWDLRGTGRSDAPPGPYSVATLAADLEAVLAAHGAEDVHLVGAGLGGMVALAHALEGGRAATLTLLGTTADGGRVNGEALDALAAPRDDPDALRETLAGAFSAGGLAEEDGAAERIVAWRGTDDAGPDGWEAQAAAMTGFDASDRLHEVTRPALVCHGRHDGVVPVDAGRDLGTGLPRGSFRALDAGHLVAVEAAGAVEDALAAFLGEHADVDL